MIMNKEKHGNANEREGHRHNHTNRREQIESLLNMQDPITKLNWMRWNKGDCSEIGLCEILLSQLIREHKLQNGDYYDTDYDEIKLRYE